MNLNRCFEQRILQRLVLLALSLLLSAGTAPTICGQRNFTRDHAEHILEVIKGDIKKNYYDPEFHGINLEERFRTAKEKLKSANSGAQMMTIIAQVLLDFDDSHLFFIPPGRSNPSDYGWEMRTVGDQVFVSAVKPHSDAETKGVKAGDQILSLAGYEPTRENLWKIEYLIKGLSPKLSLRLNLRSPDGKERELDLAAKVKPGKTVLTGADFNDLIREAENEDHYRRSRYVTPNEDLFIWKLPTFAVEEETLDSLMSKARKYKTIILDLRGNGGGYVTTCQRLGGFFFDKDLIMAEPRGRKKMKPMKAQRVGTVYTGQLIVLIDAGSASASEIFARVVQLEKRGIVIGDRSAGAVMESLQYPHELGVDTIIPYAVSVTEADVIMADGKSLEKTGVTPDEVVLPSAADLLANRDPVIVRAAALAGVQLTPEKAGLFFPIEWRK
jgi:carboxyl-terminal processing protease